MTIEQIIMECEAEMEIADINMEAAAAEGEEAEAEFWNSRRLAFRKFSTLYSPMERDSPLFFIAAKPVNLIFKVKKRSSKKSLSTKTGNHKKNFCPILFHPKYFQS